MARISMGKSGKGLILALSAAGALAASFVVLPALAGQSPDMADDMDTAAQVLVKLDNDWSKVAATRDADRLSSYYAEDAIVYPPNELVAMGRAGAKKVWAAYLADKTFSISWKTVHAEVAKSGDLGFTAGTYEDSFKGPDGKQVNEKGKYLCTWKKQKDGSWKAIHDIWNSDAK